MYKQSFLTNYIKTYTTTDYYPFHMPGHKRKELPFPNPWTIDLTEINGFDDLHHPHGILEQLQHQIAALYHTKESYLLINGSTCGILAAISACVKRNGTLALARNCHNSVYNGAYLRQLCTIYLTPQVSDFGIHCSLAPNAVEEVLLQNKNIAAVMLVSPTYEGIVSDIKTIAQITHRYNIPLIVDEAHGAHFPFSHYFPDSALSCGADIVIQSLHKTLPSFTQTALLHVNSDRIDNTAICKFLKIYQSSSPSYLLMASIDQCLGILRNEGKELFTAFERNLDIFYNNSMKLQHLQIFSADNTIKSEYYAHDKSKLLISTGNTGLSGKNLQIILRERYHLETEMAAGHYVIALTSIMDNTSGFERLWQALQQIDQEYCLDNHSKGTDILNSRNQYHIPSKKMEIYQAIESPGRSTLLTDACGCISQEYLYLYPPGIPLLAPGEMIDSSLLQHIKEIKTLSLQLEGLVDDANTRITVVNL
jgi:arginine/lysine/ornithine decarboxylase